MKQILTYFCLILLSIFIIEGDLTSKEEFPVLKGPYLGQKPPGMKPELFAPGIVSTKDHIEMGFTCTSDGREIYFARSERMDIDSYFAIWVVRQKNGKWSKPEVAPFSGVYRDFGPFVTPDGKYLLFYRMSSKKAQIERGTYIIEKQGDTFGEPGYFFNAYCMTSADFKTFYFSTEKDKKTSRDLAMVQWDNGDFLTPEKLKGSINSDEWEAHGCISPDGTYIIFDRIQHTYVSFLQKDNKWSKGYQLPGKFHVPIVSGNGKYIFFEANGDIHWVSTKIIEAMRPEESK
jgi:Tol biopolymer transport system component